jgi:hypothetical protein
VTEISRLKDVIGTKITVYKLTCCYELKVSTLKMEVASSSELCYLSTKVHGITQQNFYVNIYRCMNHRSYIIRWRTDQLLSSDYVNNSRCYATVKILADYKNGNDIFYVVRAEMLYAGQFEATS